MEFSDEYFMQQAIKEAKKYKIPYIGLEADRKDRVNYMLKHVSKKDLMMWKCIQTYEYIQNKNGNEKMFHKELKKDIERYKKEIKACRNKN